MAYKYVSESNQINRQEIYSRSDKEDAHDMDDDVGLPSMEGKKCKRDSETGVSQQTKRRR